MHPHNCHVIWIFGESCEIITIIYHGIVQKMVKSRNTYCAAESGVFHVAFNAYLYYQQCYFLSKLFLYRFSIKWKAISFLFKVDSDSLLLNEPHIYLQVVGISWLLLSSVCLAETESNSNTSWSCSGHLGAYQTVISLGIYFLFCSQIVLAIVCNKHFLSLIKSKSFLLKISQQLRQNKV